MSKALIHIAVSLLLSTIFYIGIEKLDVRYDMDKEVARFIMEVMKDVKEGFDE